MADIDAETGELLLTVSETAERLGLSVHTVHRRADLCTFGSPPADGVTLTVRARDGRKILFGEEEILASLDAVVKAEGRLRNERTRQLARSWKRIKAEMPEAKRAIFRGRPRS